MYALKDEITLEAIPIGIGERPAMSQDGVKLLQLRKAKQGANFAKLRIESRHGCDAWLTESEVSHVSQPLKPFRIIAIDQPGLGSRKRFRRMHRKDNWPAKACAEIVSIYTDRSK